ncbi:hypothetical protein [Haladaptatus sp. DFWS20]|uniref:hypothetical protein n=1 Tax=Haladaptatus sp. DFWS20 TaxID=3403467 RepID=UPI003EC03042
MKTVTDDGTWYEQVAESDSRSSRNGADFQPRKNHDRLYSLLLAFNVTNIEQIDNSSEPPLYRVTASELTNSDGFSQYSFESVENASLVFVVDTWGLIHRYRFEATGTSRGESARVTESVQVSNVGNTTVSRPSWYRTALETENASRNRSR